MLRSLYYRLRLAPVLYTFSHALDQQHVDYDSVEIIAPRYECIGAK